MKRFVWLPLFLGLALAVCGCAGSAKSAESVQYDAAPAEAPAAMYAEESVGNGAVNSVEAESVEPADSGVRKIIYTGDLYLTADDPAAVLETVTQKALSLGGYIASSYTDTDDDGAYRATATLKVPAASLDALVTAAKGEGTVDSYSLSSDDISLSYYDIQARLESAKAEETQLLSILAGCSTVEDVLAVREELRQVRADIESYQAQINLWDELVDYATLQLSVVRTAKTPVEGEGSLIEIWKASDVWNKISRGFANSARFTVNALGAIGIFLAYALIPAAILFAAIGVPIIVSHKRKKRRAEAGNAVKNVEAPIETTKQE